ncbi:hypothetical protein BOX15_Mlig033550g1, partial [Macrostomum lignano]
CKETEMRRHGPSSPTSDRAPSSSSNANNNSNLAANRNLLAGEYISLFNAAFGHVTCGLVFILCMSQCGIFDVVQTDTDLSRYAERHSLAWLPTWLPMPLNTAVNFGYSFCGIYWLLRVKRLFLTGSLSRDAAYLFSVFAVMATAYGPVQLARIVRMSHNLAVVDQWVTLPFFAWVPIWVISTVTGHLSAGPILITMVASLLSYLLAVVTDVGFELALTLHVSAAMGSGIFLCLYPGLSSATGLIKNVALAALSCVGFVGLKLLDHELANLCPAVFRIVSGHFLSKLADVMQIHCVCKAFECVALIAAGNDDGRKLA